MHARWNTVSLPLSGVCICSMLVLVFKWCYLYIFFFSPLRNWNVSAYIISTEPIFKYHLVLHSLELGREEKGPPPKGNQGRLWVCSNALYWKRWCWLLFWKFKEDIIAWKHVWEHVAAILCSSRNSFSTTSPKCTLRHPVCIRLVQAEAWNQYLRNNSCLLETRLLCADRDGLRKAKQGERR